MILLFCLPPAGGKQKSRIIAICSLLVYSVLYFLTHQILVHGATVANKNGSPFVSISETYLFRSETQLQPLSVQGSPSSRVIYESGPINRALRFTRKDGDPCPREVKT